MGYLGYGLKAGVEGFKSGFGMAQQKSEMEWQKKKQKELEEKELKIKEGAALYNSLVSQVFADGVASEDEMMKLNTAFLAAGYEVQAVIKDSHTAIQSMDKNKLEQDLAWLDLFADMTEGLDPKDTQGTFDMIEKNVKSEKGINIFDAYGSLQTKKYEVAQKEEPWKKAAVLPAEVRPGFLRQEGVDIPEPTPTTKAPSATDRKIDWAIDNYKKGNISFEQLSKFMGTDIGVDTKGLTAKQQEVELMKQYGATNEQIKNKLLGIGEAKVTEPKPETVTTLKNWEKMFDINDKEGPRTEEEYNRALELLKQSEDKYKPKYPTWKEALIAEVKGIGKELEGTTDRTDRKILLDAYKRKLEEIKAKYPDVDLNQFPQPKELSGWDKFWEKVGF